MWRDKIEFARGGWGTSLVGVVNQASLLLDLGFGGSAARGLWLLLLRCILDNFPCLFGSWRVVICFLGSGCAAPACCPSHSCRLLDYDVVLNVELIVHVHNVDFNSRLGRGSSACRTTPLRSTLAATSRWLLHTCRNYSLHMEELLVLIPCRFVVTSRWITLASTIGSLLMVLNVTCHCDCIVLCSSASRFPARCCICWGDHVGLTWWRSILLKAAILAWIHFFGDVDQTSSCT